jgi:hypothetical protein
MSNKHNVKLNVTKGDSNVRLTLGYDIETEDGKEFLYKTLLFLCENGLESDVKKLQEMLIAKAEEMGVAS